MSQLPSDRDLVDRIVSRRDEHAFRLLFARHNPGLFSFALRLTGGRVEDAEDALQEAWGRAAKSLARFEWRASFRTWVSGILVRCVHEVLRKKHPLPLPHAEPFVAPSDLEALLDLERAFEAMPEGYRLVVTLSAEGYKHQEIATLLGISPGTSKSQLARGRGWLRRALDPAEIRATTTTHGKRR